MTPASVVQYTEGEDFMLLNKKMVGLVSIGATLLLTACTPRNETVITIGDTSLTKDEYFEMMRDEPYSNEFTYGEIILEEYILAQLLEEKYGHLVSEEDIEEEFALYAEESGGEDKLKENLAAQGLSVEYVKQDMRLGALINEGVKEFYPVDEETLKEFYDQTLPVGMEVGHIFVDEQGTAQEIIERLDNGDEFSDLALEYSVFDDVEETNGIYTLESDMFSQELIEAIFELSDGEHTKTPLQDDFGYHVLLLSDEGEETTFEEQRDEMEKQYYQELNYQDPAIFTSVMTELLKEHQEDIQIHDETMVQLVERIIASAEAVSEELSEEEIDENLVVDEEFLDELGQPEDEE